MKSAPSISAQRASDPFPYDGPLRRSDGVAPYNHYLWPLDRDWHWANRELDRNLSSRWNFSAVALADGRWLADGLIFNEAEMRFFPTREAALRHSAAKLIRTIRNARQWTGGDRVSGGAYAALVAWIMHILGRPPLDIAVKPQAPRPAPWVDLPLFANAVREARR